jgi:hypothetical protein
MCSSKQGIARECSRGLVVDSEIGLSTKCNTTLFIDKLVG